MGTKTGIEWTDATWNPIRGCSRVSEGCRHCYAETQALRFSGPGQPYAGLAVLKNGHASWTGKIEFVEKHLLDPLCWRAPRRIFVNSMSDLFHENVTDEMRDKIFAVMALSPQHMFQVLTKRPQAALRYRTPEMSHYQPVRIYDEAEALAHAEISRRDRTWAQWIEGKPISVAINRDGLHVSMAARPWPLPNVWVGVSVENQATADERIPLLLKTPAAVRFISAEPLLGPIDLRLWVYDGYQDCKHAPGLKWVICGGESGAGARPMHPEWARSLCDQCAAAGVPFFMKQGSQANWPSFKNFDSFPAELRVRQFPTIVI